MNAASRALVSSVGLDTAPYKRGGAEVVKVNRRIDGSTRKTGRGLDLLKNQLKGLVAGASLALLASQATSFSLQFSDALTEVNTLVGINRQQVNAWREDLLRLGPAAGRGPTELARALFVVTSAGERGANTLDIIDRSARASAIGLGQTAVIARTVTAAMQAYKREGLSAAEATDILVATVREGNLVAPELAGSLGRVLGIAAEVGVSFGEIGGFIATFTRLGVNSAEAVTALRGVLSTMIRPARQSEEALAALGIQLENLGASRSALQELGLSVESLRESVRERGFAETMVELVELARENEGAIARIIPNVRALSGVLGTAGSQAQQFLDIEKKVIESTGDLDTAFAGLAESPGQAFRQLKAEAEVLLIAVGDNLAKGILETRDVLATLRQTSDGVRVAFLALIGLGLATWLRATATSTGILTLANLNLATAVWAVNSGYAKLIVLDIATKLRLWAVGARGFVAALGPIALTLAAIATAAVAADTAIKKFSAAQDAAIAAATAPTQEMRREWEATEAAIRSADEAVKQARVDELTEKVLEAQAALNAAQQEVDRYADALALSLAPGAKTSEQEIQALRDALEDAQAAKGDASSAAKAYDEQLSLLLSSLEKTTAATGEAGDATKNLGEAFDDLSNQVRIAERVVELMERTELTASEAEQVVEALLSEDNNATEAQLVALVQRLEEARDLAREMDVIDELLERTAPGNLERVPVGDPFAGVTRPPNLKPLLADLDRAARLTANVATEQERHFQTINEVRELADKGLLSRQAALEIETRIQAKLHESKKDLETSDGLSSDLLSRWTDLREILSGIFSGLNEDLGRIVESAASAVASFEAFQAARESGSKADQALAGAQFGADVASFGQQLGIFQGPQRQSRFGGLTEGDLSSELGTLGGAIYGPIGAAIGSVVGGLIKRGADQAVGILEAQRDELVLNLVEDEGGLGSIVGEMASSIGEALQSIGDAVGARIVSGGGLKIKIREDTITLIAEGFRQEFKEIEDAVNAAVLFLLDQAEISGASERVKAVLKSGGFDDLEELDAVLGLAQALDDLDRGAGEVAAQIREDNALTGRQIRLAREHGLALSEVLDLQNRRLGLLRDEIDAQIDGMIGIQNFTASAVAARSAIQDFNRGVEETREQRLADLEELRLRQAALTEEAAAAGELSGALDLSRDRLDAFSESGGHLGGVFGETARTAGHAARELANVEEEIAALEGSLEGLPAAIDTERIAQAFQAAGTQATLQVIQLMRQVRGESFAAEEERRLQTQLYILQLVTARGALVELAAASEGLFSVSASLLAEVDQTIADLLSGEATLGGGSRRGTGNRRQRRGELEDMLADMERGLDVIGGAAVQIFEMREETERLAEEMGRLRTFTGEQIERFREMRAEREQLIARDASLDLETRLARMIGDQELLAELEIARMEIQLANMRLEIAALEEIGAISAETAARFGDLADRAGEVLGAGGPIDDSGLRQTLADLETGLDLVGGLAEKFVAFREETKRLADEMAAAGTFTAEEILRLRELRGVREQLLVAQGVLDIETSLARIIGDEELLAELERGRQELQIANMRLQIRTLLEMGAIAEETGTRLLGLADRADLSIADGETASVDNSGLRQTLADLELGIDLVGGVAERVVAFREETKRLADEMAAAETFTAEEILRLRELRGVREQLLVAQGVLDIETSLARIIGDEELLAELERGRQELQIANMRIQIRTLLEMGAIAEAAATRLLGLADRAELAIADAPTPSRPSTVPPATTSIPALDPAGSGAEDLERLREAIERFADAAARKAGQFTSSARQLLGDIEGLRLQLAEVGTVSDARRDVLERLAGQSLEGLSPEELAEILAPFDGAVFGDSIDILIEEARLEAAAAARRASEIEGILGAFGGTEERGLAGEIEAIQARADDAIAALELLGATEEEIAELRRRAGEDTLAAIERQLEGTRSLLDDLRGVGGNFTVGTAGQQVEAARREVEELRARLAAGDVTALDEVDAVVRRFLQAGEGFTGGVGGAFAEIRALAEAALADALALGDDLAGGGLEAAIAANNVLTSLPGNLAAELLVAAERNAATDPARIELAAPPVLDDGRRRDELLERIATRLDRLERIEELLVEDLAEDRRYHDVSTRRNRRRNVLLDRIASNSRPGAGPRAGGTR